VFAACASVQPKPAARPAFEYHYDRDALIASEPQGDAVVALTAAGHLLRFEAETFRLTAEKLEARRASALGRGDDGAVLVGFSNGSIGRLDLASLETTEVASVQGEPYWIGRCAGVTGLVVAYRRFGPQPFGWLRQAPRNLRVRVLATGAEIGVLGGALHCDERGRLWAGFDEGEWGGRISVVDLRAATLTVQQIKNDTWHGVYGFVESADGKLFAYGGTSHMGYLAAFVAQVFGPELKPRMVYISSGNSFGEDDAEIRSPFGPISHIVAAPGGGFVVFALGRIYRADRTFREWEFVGLQRLHTTSGRPDAVGSYPAIVEARSFDDGRILLTTRLDGFLVVEGAEKKSHRLADQPGIVARTLSASGSLLAIFGDGDEPSGLLADGRWLPAFDGLPRLEPPARYSAVSFLALDDGRVLMVAESKDKGWAPTPATLTTAYIEAGKVGSAFTQPGGDNYFDRRGLLFTLPDGTVAYEETDETLWTLSGTRWTRVASPTKSPPIVKSFAFGRERVVLTREDWNKPKLARLTVPFKLEAMPVRIGGKEVRVEDAAFLDADHLLVATDPVLCILDLRGGDCAIFRSGATDEARRVLRDSKGRIWIAGRGLWRLDAGRAVPYTLALPFLGDAEVLDLVGAGDRLALALGDRGVALVDPDVKGNGPPPRRLAAWESRYDDGAVIVTCTPPPGDTRDFSSDFEKQYQRLNDGIWAEQQRSGPRDTYAREFFDYDPYRDVFHTPDPGRLAARILALVQASPLARRMRVAKRAGPRGYTPEVTLFAGALSAVPE
jgi:hypothetical protein